MSYPENLSPLEAHIPVYALQSFIDSQRILVGLMVDVISEDAPENQAREQYLRAEVRDNCIKTFTDILRGQQIDVAINPNDSQRPDLTDEVQAPIVVGVLNYFGMEIGKLGAQLDEARAQNRKEDVEISRIALTETSKFSIDFVQAIKEYGIDPGIDIS